MFKLTMIFQMTSQPIGGAAVQRTGGWSESIYAETLSTANRVHFDNLMKARAALLPVNAAIVGQRYQEVDPPGASSTSATKYPGTATIASAAGQGADVPQMTLLCRTRTNLPNVRSTYLRAIPDANVVGGEFTPGSTYGGLLQKYFSELTGWQTRGRNLAGALYPIFAISSGGLLSFEAAVTLTTPVMVQVLQSTATNGIRYGGRFKATGQPTTSSAQLEGWDFPATSGGKVRVQNIIYPVMTTTDISRIIVKKIGRAPFQYRGRRSKNR